MVINLEASSSRKLKEVSDLIQPIDTFKDLLKVTEKITSNPICAKDLGVDKKIAKLDIVSETVAELNKNIGEKLDAKGKPFGWQEYKRLQQFPNEEERRAMQVPHFQQTRKTFVSTKAKKFKLLEKGVINNYFDVQKNYPSISKGIEEYINNKINHLRNHSEKLDEIGNEIVQTYKKEVLSKLRSDKIENIKDLPKNYILNSIDKVKEQIYKKTKSIYFDDSVKDEELIDGYNSTIETINKEFSDKLVQETLQKIYEKLDEKVFQIRDEFRCQVLLQEIKTQVLKSTYYHAKRSKMSLDLVLEDEKHWAKLLFLKIENFMMITIPKLNSKKGECLIDGDAVGYDQLKNQFQTHLFTQMDNVINDRKRKKLHKLHKARRHEQRRLGIYKIEKLNKIGADPYTEESNSTTYRIVKNRTFVQPMKNNRGIS